MSASPTIVPSPVTPPSPSAPSLSCPSTFTIPTIKGDPAAVYRLASAYRDLAEAVTVTQQRVGHVVAGLASSWTGRGHNAIDVPAHAFALTAAAIARALREAADELDTYGGRLAKAQRHHGWSMKKVLAVGAITAVSATAIVVTVGAASVVEAGAAAAAVGGATEAAGAASAADVAAATGIGAALEGLPSLQPLLAFVLPHLVQAEWAAAATAEYGEIRDGRLNWKGIADSAGTAFIASGAAAKGRGLVADGSAWLSHLVESGTWSGAAAADDKLSTGSVSPADVVSSFVLAGGTTVARDALREHGLWLAEPDYRRAALVALSHQPGRITDREIAHELALLRQPVKELQRGDVDLQLNEGPGHTIDRHVSKSAGDLLHRVRTSRVRVASTYWDQTSARDAIQHTLRANDDTIKRWVAAGSSTTLRLHLKVPYDLGFAVDRSGKVTFVRQATVVLRRDSAGIVVVTSYPISR